MTVVDTSVIVDVMAGEGVATAAWSHMAGPLAAPDVLIYEFLAVLRRDVLRGDVSAERALVSLANLTDLRIELFPALGLVERAFALRDNLTAADALFVALAEVLGDVLLTKDRSLARAANEHTGVEVLLIG